MHFEQSVQTMIMLVSYIEEGVVPTFLLLWFLFRLSVNLLQILDDLLSCLKTKVQTKVRADIPGARV